MDPDIEALRGAWLEVRDGATGHEYGEALEARGEVTEARVVYEQLIESDYLIGYAALAWLEHTAGNRERAKELLRSYLELDDEPDEQTAVVAGLLGHWLWDETHDVGAESLLTTGASFYSSARVDLAHLYRATGRAERAESLLRDGIERGELDSYIVLGNLLDESGRSSEAESLYRRGFELGDAFCAYNLHLLLARDGRAEEANDWLRVGAARGDEKAIARLAHLTSSND